MQKSIICKILSGRFGQLLASSFPPILPSGAKLFPFGVHRAQASMKTLQPHRQSNSKRRFLYLSSLRGVERRLLSKFFRAVQQHEKEVMFDADYYADFANLWLLLPQTAAQAVYTGLNLCLQQPGVPVPAKNEANLVWTNLMRGPLANLCAKLQQTRSHFSTLRLQITALKQERNDRKRYQR